QRCNREMVLLEAIDESDEEFVKGLIERHCALTGSRIGERVLEQWSTSVARFVRVMPIEYKKALEAQGAETLGVAVWWASRQVFSRSRGRRRRGGPSPSG